ncbi:hypothetical protein QAD02_010057 [Eretmocerus hayati]|uniref:Uncharacterized protein n=1 Tax=Eretmocerus hayati TaxID=131215 RepID=A0ACC2NB02_9HYME|nr:hypothetical protein QAD02_010057 [Eretmocerus hayati]
MVLFAEFTDNQISTGNTGLYKPLDDVKDSDSVLVIDHVYIDITFGGDDSALEFLRSRKETTDDYLNCPKRILRNENVICLTSESAALYSIKNNSRGMGSRGMEIMNHIFWSAPKGYFSSRGSLYVGEVNKILSRISEGRLWARSWARDYASPESGKDIIEKSVDHELSRKLCLIWLSGCALSTVVFFVELLVHGTSKANS